MTKGRWKRYVYEVIAAEISAQSRFYDRLFQIMPVPHDPGLLLELIQCPVKQKIAPDEPIPDLSGETDRRTILMLNGTFNHHLDIQGLLTDLKPKLSRTSRLIVVAYNPYLAWLYRLADRLGLRESSETLTFLTHTDLNDLAKLSGYEVVRSRPSAYFPFRLLGLGWLLNTLMPILPILRWISFASVITIRPVIRETGKPSLSIVIPARNERGNIETALKRIPRIEGCHIEVIFVEGGSADGTWEEIQRVRESGTRHFTIRALKQSGKGKGDAVRLGFGQATGDLLTILDADLTMPPEMLVRFYDAYCQGLADFINGSRLVYPMEGEAMRFLNRLGNVFFAKALSHVLSVNLGDTLCGTKLMSKHDYRRFEAWRQEFGDFDPFGDFELLFPAAILGLGIVDIPVAYRSRTYGQTNISRFTHGWMLLKMTLTGLFRIRTGRAP